VTSDSAGDRSQAWRDSYRRVRKDPLVRAGTTNRRRLASVGAASLPTGGRWLDLGSGDGNLTEALLLAGAGRVLSLDYQLDLLRHVPPAADRVVGSAVQLPLRTASLDVVVIMDVLHHLEPTQHRPAAAEVARVLRPGGQLLVFEPVDTVVRRSLGVALLSPLSGLTQFSRDKRQMVEEEASTLMPFLRAERDLPTWFRDAGFTVVSRRRGALHGAYRFRRS
jgi:ubiquinone/menaquinone biosynthesis C-methylase UbiE